MGDAFTHAAERTHAPHAAGADDQQIGRRGGGDEGLDGALPLHAHRVRRGASF